MSTSARRQQQDLISRLADSENCVLVLRLDSGLYDVSDTVVSDPPPAPAPAREGAPPRRRGGRAYFTENPIFKMDCGVSDVSVLDALPKAMLGPQTDFADVHVDIKCAGRSVVRLVANVTSSVLLQAPEMSVRLGLVVVDVVDPATGSRLEPGFLDGILGGASSP